MLHQHKSIYRVKFLQQMTKTKLKLLILVIVLLVKIHQFVISFPEGKESECVLCSEAQFL